MFFVRDSQKLRTATQYICIFAQTKGNKNIGNIKPWWFTDISN